MKGEIYCIVLYCIVLIKLSTVTVNMTLLASSISGYCSDDHFHPIQDTFGKVDAEPRPGTIAV